MRTLKQAVVTALSLCLVVSMATFAFAGERSLTVVATKAQFADMKTLANDLKDEDVAVKHVEPTDFAKVQNDDYLILVITGQGNDPIVAAAGDKLLSASDKDRLAKAGGKKLIVKRDTWKTGQEIVCFAGNTEADTITIRKETKGTWWEIVGSWFDINTSGMHGY